MSRVATALTKSLEDLRLKQTEFGEQADLTRVQVNRACRSGAVGPEVIEKIVRALPAPQNAIVLAAWLADEVPPGLEGLITIECLGGHMNEEPPRRRPVLDDQREKLLQWVESKITATEFCDMLASLRTALDAE